MINGIEWECAGDQGAGYDHTHPPAPMVRNNALRGWSCTLPGCDGFIGDLLAREIALKAGSRTSN